MMSEKTVGFFFQLMHPREYELVIGGKSDLMTFKQKNSVLFKNKIRGAL